MPTSNYNYLSIDSIQQNCCIKYVQIVIIVLLALPILLSSCVCAFRLLKIRCEKSKFQTSSTSTKHVFQNVLDEMNKCAPENIGTSPWPVM